jgi:phytoene desaturase
MRPHASVDGDLRRYFSDPRVRLAFSFQTKYLGMSPFRCPSLFTILSFLEYEHGVFHPIGGCGAVSDAMAALARRMGVDIRLGTPVERVLYRNGRPTGVAAGGETVSADAVVVNGDFGHAVRRLVPEEQRRRWPDAKIDRARLSCSTFMLYLGIEGDVGPLEHHTIFLAGAYERNIGEVSGGVLSEEPSIYVQHAGRSDPGMAPASHTSPLRARPGSEPPRGHRLARRGAAFPRARPEASRGPRARRHREPHPLRAHGDAGRLARRLHGQ